MLPPSHARRSRRPLLATALLATLVTTSLGLSQFQLVAATAPARPAGPLDTTFGTAGTGTVQLAAPTGSEVKAIAIQPADNKIVAVGSSQGAFLVMRFDPKGGLDASFGPAGANGVVRTAIGGHQAGEATGVAIDSHANIVVVGHAATGIDMHSGQAQPTDDLVVVRYTPDGTVDSKFGGGVVTTPRLSAANGSRASLRANDVVLQHDPANGDRIVAVGGACEEAFAGSNGYNVSFAAVRYDTNGTVDTSFGTAGISLVAPTINLFGGCPPELALHGAAVQPDGKVIGVGGAVQSSRQFAVLRLDAATGSLDPEFNGGHTQTTGIGSAEDMASAVAVRAADGEIVVAGTTNQHGANDLALARYARDGTLLGTPTITDVDGNDEGRAVAVLPDGRIVVAGTSSGGFTVARFLADGTPDPAFGTSGAATTPIGANAAINALAVQGCGIVAGGSATTGTSQGVALARYHGLDPSVTGIAGDKGPSVGGSGTVLSGSCFDASTAVDFGGALGTGLAPAAAGTQLAATTPAHAPGVVKVTMAGQPAGLATAPDYTFLPTVSGLYPTHGDPKGGQTVTISGDGFAQATDVSFDGVPAKVTKRGQNDTIVVETPAHDKGQVRIAVTIAVPAALRSTTPPTAPDADVYIYDEPKQPDPLPAGADLGAGGDSKSVVRPATTGGTGTAPAPSSSPGSAFTGGAVPSAAQATGTAAAPVPTQGAATAAAPVPGVAPPPPSPVPGHGVVPGASPIGSPLGPPVAPGEPRPEGAPAPSGGAPAGGAAGSRAAGTDPGPLRYDMVRAERRRSAPATTLGLGAVALAFGWLVFFPSDARPAGSCVRWAVASHGGRRRPAAGGRRV